MRMALATDADAFQAHLETGEFAPALTLAQAEKDPAQRNSMLGRLARMQLESRAVIASLATARLIDDLESRSRAVRSIGDYRHRARGGGSQADFDQLIELITNTVVPDSWEENGGTGTISPFEGGVIVDPEGFLRHVVLEETAGDLVALRRDTGTAAIASSVRRSSSLRCVSLPRLEAHIERLHASGRSPSEAMRVLAGITRIQYVLLYPDRQDLVIAGPAGAWTRNVEGRIVSSDNGRPVVRLDDLTVVLRHYFDGPGSRFGCSITPLPEGLSRAKSYLDASSGRPLRPGQRKRWLTGLRDCLGQQDIEVFGIDARTRAARVLVEADYHMKLIGMGLAESVLGVPSYLELIHVPKGQSLPPMDVLRWWFTLDYPSVRTTPSRNGYAIRGPGVKVLSENELLTAQGRRIPTGKSEALNQQFTSNFNAHFKALATKYPVYAELQNVFDLALVAALIKHEQLATRVGWTMMSLLDPYVVRVGSGRAPTNVETVINHRLINRRHFVAGVSGGVSVNPVRFLASRTFEPDSYGDIAAVHAAKAENPDSWWWDPK